METQNNQSIEQPVSYQQPETNKKGGKKVLTIVSIIIGLIVVGGGGAFAYFKYSEPSPEELIKGAISSLYEADSLSYEGEITAEIEPGLIEEGSPIPLGDDKLFILLDLAGKLDKSDEDNIKNAIILDLKIESLSDSLQVGMNFGIEFISIGEDLYLKATKIPPILPFDLTPLINQWIRTDKNNLENQLPGKTEIEEQKLSEEQVEEIREFVSNSSILKNIEKLEDEEINGVNTSHFRFQLDREEMKKISAELRRMRGTELTQEQIAEVEATIDNLNIEDNEVWIGKSDRLLRKASFGFNLYQGEDNSQQIGSVKAEILFDDYNEQMEITAPESTKTFEEVFSLLFADMFVVPEMEASEVNNPGFEPEFPYEVNN